MCVSLLASFCPTVWKQQVFIEYLLCARQDFSCREINDEIRQIKSVSSKSIRSSAGTFSTLQGTRPWSIPDSYFHLQDSYFHLQDPWGKGVSPARKILEKDYVRLCAHSRISYCTQKDEVLLLTMPGLFTHTVQGPE